MLICEPFQSMTTQKGVGALFFSFINVNKAC